MEQTPGKPPRKHRLKLCRLMPPRYRWLSSAHSAGFGSILPEERSQICGISKNPLMGRWDPCFWCPKGTWDVWDKNPEFFHGSFLEQTGDLFKFYGFKRMKHDELPELLITSQQ